jgi:hypothetical protein
MREIYKTDSHVISVVGEQSSIESTKKEKLLKSLGKLRGKFESGGVDFNGVIIKTDEGSIAKITSTVMGLQSGLMSSIDWKGHNGWIKNVQFDTMMQIASVVGNHVQKCFRVENQIVNEIEMLTESELDNYDIFSRWDFYYNQ